MSDLPVTVDPHSMGIDVSHEDLASLFPKVDPQFRPFGSRVLVQLRRVVEKTASGILLATETKQTEAWNMQVGKIIAVGPLAFKDRRTGEFWPEGEWAREGDFVRFARWAGDRLTIDMGKNEQPVVVLVVNDSDLYGAYEGDPRVVKTFIS